jgi:hypothetical protein
MLELAAALCVFIGLVHSVLGERYILVRLFRGAKIPHLFGSDHFTRRTLRFAWHLTTLAWWGMGYMVWGVSREVASPEDLILSTVLVVFLVSGAVALLASRGKHLSWVVFWAIAGLVYLAAGS